jgi:hypothetical protein
MQYGGWSVYATISFAPTTPTYILQSIVRITHCHNSIFSYKFIISNLIASLKIIITLKIYDCPPMFVCQLLLMYFTDFALGCQFFASNKKMQNEAKRSEKDAKQNSKLARLSETKQNKVRMTQFHLREPFKTILNQKETCEK